MNFLCSILSLNTYSHYIYESCTNRAGATILDFFKKNYKWFSRLVEDEQLDTLETHVNRLFDRNVPRAGLTVCVFDKETNEYLVFYSNKKLVQSVDLK